VGRNIIIRPRTSTVADDGFWTSKTATYYVCTSCQSFYEQPLGRVIEKTNEKNGQVNLQFKTAGGPPTTNRCSECDSTLHVNSLYSFWKAM
jgi:hypothetical protein